MFAKFEWFTNNVMWGLPLLLLCGGFGVYATIRSGFFQFRMLPKILKYPFSKEANGGVSFLLCFHKISREYCNRCDTHYQ